MCVAGYLSVCADMGYGGGKGPGVMGAIGLMCTFHLWSETASLENRLQMGRARWVHEC